MTTKKLVLKARTLLQMTVEEFSDFVGCETRTVYRWQSGKSEPCGSTVLRILELCAKRGIKYDDLV